MYSARILLTVCSTISDKTLRAESDKVNKRLIKFVETYSEEVKVDVLSF